MKLTKLGRVLTYFYLAFVPILTFPHFCMIVSYLVTNSWFRYRYLTCQSSKIFWIQLWRNVRAFLFPRLFTLFNDLRPSNATKKLISLFPSSSFSISRMFFSIKNLKFYPITNYVQLWLSKGIHILVHYCLYI